jgi:hypothetical protein
LKKPKFAVAWCEAISVAGGGLVNFGFLKNQLKNNGWSEKFGKKCK